MTAYNFSGGPGALPDVVLQAAQQAVNCVPEVGLSVLGISHRSDWFRSVLDEAENNIRTLLNISDDFHVLFLQGGSSLQFFMIPTNLGCTSNTKADYVVSGYWSEKALMEANTVCDAGVLWSGKSSGYTTLPTYEAMRPSSDAAYLHYVSNETVEGLQFDFIPPVEDIPLICDMSSDFTSKPIALDRYKIVYAHAQKNLGPAGVTVVIVHNDIVDRIPGNLPQMLDYCSHIQSKSIYNTPPVFALYVVMLATRWLINDIGGLKNMESINAGKAAKFYQCIDESNGFYQGHAAIANRSTMNATFRLPTPALENKFLQTAIQEGFFGLEGHRSIGGLRASLYNAVTPEAVDALTSFMNDFQRSNDSR
jgi:phosphoserine aminotransferase